MRARTTDKLFWRHHVSPPTVHLLTGDGSAYADDGRLAWPWAYPDGEGLSDPQACVGFSPIRRVER